MRYKKCTIVCKSIRIALGFIFLCCSTYGQVKKTLRLDEVLKIASRSSLEAFKAKRQHAIGYWEYQSFKASLLPNVNLDLQPFTFNRSFIQRYDPANNIDVYRQQRNLNTFGQLSINQNIMATGATVYINSSFNRFVNFSDTTIENYSTTPIRVGLTQPLMAFNELKWQNKTAALEYERAKKDYISQEQAIYIETVSLFFRWALANTKVKISEENQKNAQRLYEIGKKRYPLGTIERDDLLNLELETFTADTDKAQADQGLQEVVSELQIFLNEGEDLSDYAPELPEVISSLKIGLEEAKEKAQQHNPELLDIEIQKINAQRDLDQAIKENRFDLSISASYGLNQQAEEFSRAYSNFLDQQMVALQFSMPLLDWGERKGNIKTARMTKELADTQAQQDVNDINQQLVQAVNNFNLQENLVTVALKTRDISRESYDITEKRFLSGKVDLLRLLTAREAWQTATEGYIQSLQSYWDYYYSVQQLTLYNFMDETTLSEDFDKLLD